MQTNETKYAFLFPGQGSQAVGMGYQLVQSFPIAKETFEEADETLGFPLSKLAWEGPEDELNDTVNTQPALLAHSVAALRVLNMVRSDLKAQYIAGHSMGELSALVAAKSLAYPEALHLVRTRGRLMKAAGDYSPGGMAAIIGLDIETLDRICTEASSGSDFVQVANDNCPGQVVISGTPPALERAMQLSRDSGARRVVRLKVSIGAHSPLMNQAQEEFNRAVDNAPIVDPAIPIIGNVSADLLNNATQVRNDLQSHLHSRVRWTETIKYILSQGITNFYEIGSGSVLTGLLRRNDRQSKGFPLGSPQDFEKLES